jgi:hypothetical protein
VRAYLHERQIAWQIDIDGESLSVEGREPVSSGGRQGAMACEAAFAKGIRDRARMAEQYGVGPSTGAIRCGDHVATLQCNGHGGEIALVKQGEIGTQRKDRLCRIASGGGLLQRAVQPMARLANGHHSTACRNIQQIGAATDDPYLLWLHALASHHEHMAEHALDQ